MRHMPSPEFGTLMERNIKRAIIETLDEVAPGWNFIPGHERNELTVLFRRLARDVQKRRFLTDRAVV